MIYLNIFKEFHQMSTFSNNFFHGCCFVLNILAFPVFNYSQLNSIFPASYLIIFLILLMKTIILKLGLWKAQFLLSWLFRCHMLIFEKYLTLDISIYDDIGLFLYNFKICALSVLKDKISKYGRIYKYKFWDFIQDNLRKFIFWGPCPCG